MEERYELDRTGNTDSFLSREWGSRQVGTVRNGPDGRRDLQKIPEKPGSDTFFFSFLSS